MGDPQRTDDPLSPDDGGGPPVLSANAARYASMSAEERLVAVQQLEAVLGATHAELLDVVAACDAAGDWVDDGATEVAPWLVGRLGLARTTANEWVRVAEALQGLPALRQAYSGGGLSWDQVRHATRFVTGDDDAEQAARLAGYSAAQIARLARQCRPIADDEANDAHAQRHFGWRRDHRRGGFVYRGFVPFDQGAAINTAVDDIAESMGPDPQLGSWAPVDQRRADALAELATRRLGSASAPDRATVVLHTDAADPSSDTPANGFLGDVAICPSAIERALCDARVEVAVHGADGATVGVVRASQTSPWWLRRQVHYRDGTCRGFGCERRIRQIHHIDHWTNGGPTNLDNLVGLCWAHHRLVHEGGWHIEGNPNGEICFVSPTNRRLPSRPQPLDPTLRAKLRHINHGQLTPTTETQRPPPPPPQPPSRPPPDADAA